MCKFLLQKILKKILVVENIVIHDCENFQSQTCYILICAKKINLARFQNFEICALFTNSDLHISLFFPNQNITSLRMKFFTVVDHNIIYNHDFFQNFLKQKFADSIFSLETELHVTRPPYRR